MAQMSPEVATCCSVEPLLGIRMGYPASTSHDFGTRLWHRTVQELADPCRRLQRIAHRTKHLCPHWNGGPRSAVSQRRPLRLRKLGTATTSQRNRSSRRGRIVKAVIISATPLRSAVRMARPESSNSWIVTTSGFAAVRSETPVTGPISPCGRRLPGPVFALRARPARRW